MTKELFGKILKPRGLKGELKVMSASDVPALKTVTVYGKDYSVTSLTFADNFYYLKLGSVSNIEAAEALRGAEVYYERSEETLPAGTYYVSDLIGSEVVLGDKAIGRVTAVDSFGAADVMTIEGDGITVRIPHLKKLIISFDIESKTLTLDQKTFEETAVYED